VKSGGVQVGLPRVLPPTDGLRREAKQSFIDTIILQTSSDVWPTLDIHITLGQWDRVRISIAFLQSRILATATTTNLYIQDPFKLTHELVGATATLHLQKAGVHSRMIEQKLEPTTDSVATLRAISSPTCAIQPR